MWCCDIGCNDQRVVVERGCRLCTLLGGFELHYNSSAADRVPGKSDQLMGDFARSKPLRVEQWRARGHWWQ